MENKKNTNMRKIPIGAYGLPIGAVAVFVAIFSKEIEAKVEQPEERTTTQLLMDMGKTLLKTQVLKEEVQTEPSLSKVEYAYMTLGFIAMIIGVISWVKKDHISISGAAVSLGLVAISWEYVLFGIALAVVLIAISIFMG